MFSKTGRHLSSFYLLIHLLATTLIIKDEIAAQLLPTDVFGNGRFYYQSLHPSNQFYSNVPFISVYTSPATSVTWSGPSGCTFTPDTSLSSIPNAAVVVQCIQSGFTRFQVLRNNDPTTTDTFVVNIQPQEMAGCYYWYFVTLDDNNEINTVDSNQGNLVARVWVVDPSTQSDTESNGLATLPSSSSAGITQSFYKLGESPIVSPSINNVVITSLNFDETNRTWILTYNVIQPGESILYINSSTTSIMNCWIAAGTFSLSVMKYDFLNFQALTKVQLADLYLPSSSNSSTTWFQVGRDACANNNVFLTNTEFQNSFLYSQGGWKNSSFKYFDLTKQMVGFNVNFILQVVATSNSIVVLTDSNLITLPGLQNAVLSKGVNYPVTDVRSAPFCENSNLGDALTFSQAVVTWNRKPNVPVFFYSVDEGRSFTKITVVLNDGLSSPSMIQDITFQPIYTSLVLLVRTVDGSDQTVFYDTKQNVFTRGFVFNATELAYVLDGGKKGAQPRLVSVPTISLEVFLWGDGLFYSPNGGLSVFPVSLQSRDPARPSVELDTNEFVQEIAISNDGQVAILTSYNRLFYSKIGISYAIEITGGISSTDVARVAFDVDGSLQVLTLANTTSPFVHLRRIPLENELQSPRAPINFNQLYNCPYSEWTSNLQPVYFVDSGTQVNIEANILSTSQQGNDISTSISDLSLITVTKNVTSIPMSQYQSNYQNNLIAFEITPSDYYVSGSTGIRLQPLESNVACSKVQELSKIVVGCPPGRHIVFHREWWDPAATACDGAPGEVIISGGSYVSNWQTMETPSLDIAFNYNCTQYGSPIRRYYKNRFYPTLDLYDGTTFVQTVPVDFVLWEVNSRNSFTYADTASGVGCLQAPQTWASMIAKDYQDPFSSWTPENYVSCFNTSQPSVLSGSSGSLPYQIFSNSVNNSIVWGGDYDTIYLFSARVLDPTYSHCTLTTQFAIEVYGAPVAISTQILIVTMTTLGLIVSLGITYFYFRKKALLEKKTD